jgi:hypothetical protein
MATVELERNVERAVRHAQGVRELRSYLQGLIDGGELTPEQLEAVLRVVYEHFRRHGDETAADLTLDGLDLVTGWCGPGMGVTEHPA